MSVVLAASLSTGCAALQPTKARAEVSDMVATRVGVDDAISLEVVKDSRERVQARVAELLEHPLSLDDALRLALLNNRRFQAKLEALGIAQADLVEAGLLENPVIAGDFVISSLGNGFGGGLSLSQSLLSVFLIPAKRRIAKARLGQTVVQVGQQALVLSRDVKLAYVGVQAAAARLEIQRGLTQAAEVSDELSARQFEAGNIAPLDRELFAAAFDEARLALADAELELVVAREQLNRELGLWGGDLAWTLAHSLAEIPASEATLSDLEQRGIRDRLDLSAARFEVASMQAAIRLRRAGVVPQLEAGVEARNEVGDDVGHEWVIGPSLSLELPIFNPGHADFARLQATLRQAQHYAQGLAIDARSEIRVGRERLVTARRKVEYYRGTVLPRVESIVALSLERYNGMQIGTYQLLEARADLFRSRREYVDALTEYWEARGELELAIGGDLTRDNSAPGPVLDDGAPRGSSVRVRDLGSM
ncbi:TolC family protein [Enhygromyxa salina]|nr:TolC family protein [Enhygromyxa salina]